MLNSFTDLGGTEGNSQTSLESYANVGWEEVPSASTLLSMNRLKSGRARLRGYACILSSVLNSLLPDSILGSRFHSSREVSHRLSPGHWLRAAEVPRAAPTLLPRALSRVCSGRLLPLQLAYPPTCCSSQAPLHTLKLFCKRKQMKQNLSQRVFIDKETESLCRFTRAAGLFSQYCHLLLVWHFWRKPMENLHPMPGRV